jgi:ribonuclease Z
MAPDDAERARTHQHLHLAEAIALARDSGARRVWLTHFSQSIADPGAYAAEARAACPAIEIGHDGLTAHLTFDEEEV